MQALHQAAFETLETRQMMSTTTTVPTTTPTTTPVPTIPMFPAPVTVNATAGADHVSVSMTRDGRVQFDVNGVKTLYDPRPASLSGAYRTLQINLLAGNDTLTVSSSVPCAVSVKGGAGDDSLVGGSKNDTIYGGEGGYDRVLELAHDTIQGGFGDDKLSANFYGFGNVWGGPGNDLIEGHDGYDFLAGDTGNDTISGHWGRDTIYGGAGDDDLSGGIADDFLDGQEGNDTVHGDERVASTLGHNDTVLGGAGMDMLFGDAGDDFFQAEDGSDFYIGGSGRDTLTYQSRTAAVSVTLDNMQNDGGAGEEDFVQNDVEAIYGGQGNDLLQGGAGNEFLCGYTGNDTLDGQGGSDSLFGWLGNDLLKGGDGEDLLYGEAGSDTLQGGAGNDISYGGDDNDVLISIGGGFYDKNYGQAGYDSFWTDPYETTDADANEIFSGAVHTVAFFSNGASMELNGQNIADPSTLQYTSSGTTEKAYTRYASQPLFAKAGPTVSDINQGGLADCWFLASLAAIAKANPNFIQQTVVDLRDGTYAVRFVKDGVSKYYRVDNELPGFAKFGKENSMWVPVLEKAMAIFYHDANTYYNLNNDNCARAFEAFGITSSSTDSTQLLLAKAMVDGGNAVVGGTWDFATGLGDGITGHHVYTVLGVQTQTIGGMLIPMSVTVRNPYGGTNDGVQTVSAVVFMRNFRSLNFAVV